MRRLLAAALAALACLASAGVAQAADPCLSIPSHAETCGVSCDPEGSEEERVRAAEAEHNEALEAECKAREGREVHEAEAEERAEAAQAKREWAQKPRVTLAVAELFARRAMRQTELAHWHYDCRGGKLDRTHWACTAWGYFPCAEGRIVVRGAGHINGRPYFIARYELRPCSGA